MGSEEEPEGEAHQQQQQQQQQLASGDSEGLAAQLLQQQQAAPQLYSARFWVAGVFSCFAFMQGLCWAIPGPISSAYITLYGSSDPLFTASTVQLFVNLGPIFYLPFSLPMALWMDLPGGVRLSTLLSILLVSLGQLLRTLATDASQGSLAMLYASFIANATAGPVAMSAVGKISEAWFAPKERATATAVMAEANLLGVAAAQLVGPLIVQTASWAELGHYNNLLLGCCCLTLLAALLYFPAHPPSPPSTSASAVKRNEAAMSLKVMLASVAQLLRSRNFLVLALAYGMTTGMFGSWSTVLSINLSGCSATLVGWLSFSMTVAGGLGGIVAGLVVDRFRSLKRLLVALVAQAGLCFSLFALLCAGAWPGMTVCLPDGSSGPGMGLLFTLGMLGGLFLNSCIPLFL
jgi:FLVCR family MFS transporter